MQSLKAVVKELNLEEQQSWVELLPSAVYLGLLSIPRYLSVIFWDAKITKILRKLIRGFESLFSMWCPICLKMVYSKQLENLTACLQSGSFGDRHHFIFWILTSSVFLNVSGHYPPSKNKLKIFLRFHE